MLRTLSLNEFKSFKTASAPLGPLTILVGTNASGKSNVREALRVLHGIGLGYSMADILGDKYGPGGILQWRGIRGGAHEAAFWSEPAFQFGVEGDARLGDNPASVLYWVIVRVNDPSSGPLVAVEFLSCKGKVTFSVKHGPTADGGSKHQLAAMAPFGPISAIPIHTDLTSTRSALTQIAGNPGEDQDIRAQCAAVAKLFASMRFLDLDPDAMRQPSLPGQVILGDRGENLSSVLMSIRQDPEMNTTLLEWVRALTPMDVTDFVFKTDHLGKVLVYLKESNGFEASAYSASDGTLRFLAIIAALLSRDSGRIYFFEEIDNGIHPTRLHLLLDLVQRACRTQGVQVIATTHNPALLAFLDETARNDALLVYRTDSKPGSQIVRIMDLPHVKEVLESQDLGVLHQAGWLEDAAIFNETDTKGGDDGD